MSSRSEGLPDVASILGPLLMRVPPEQRPLLLALAERMAADRYRGWAQRAGAGPARDRLLACADREEEIAGRVEAAHPEAAAVQQDILAAHPDLEELNRTLFEGRPLADQFEMQAAGERAGASTWLAFAAQASDAKLRDVYLDCAPLEEANAAALADLLREP